MAFGPVSNLYRIHCNTEAADVDTWSSTTPTECPNNAGHEIGEINLMTSCFDQIYLSDGTDVWKVTVGTDGVLSTTKQT